MTCPECHPDGLVLDCVKLGGAVVFKPCPKCGPPKGLNQMKHSKLTYERTIEGALAFHRLFWNDTPDAWMWQSARDGSDDDRMLSERLPHIVRCVNAMDEAVAAMGRSVQILNTWASANPNTAEVQSIASRPIAVAADMFAVMVDLKQALRLAEAPERPQSPASEL